MSRLASAGSSTDSRPSVVEQPGVTTPGARVWYFLRNPYLTLVSRLLLGGIFLLSGLTKLGVPAAFAASINSYEMPLPQWLVELMANGLPILELALGVWLIVGLFTRFSAALAGVLMVVFLIAITQAWLRGLDINCGCFGVPLPGGAAAPTSNPLGVAILKAMGPVGDFLGNEKAGPESIVRDLVFLLMSVHLFFVPTVFSLDNLRGRGNAEEDYEEEPEYEEEAGEYE